MEEIREPDVVVAAREGRFKDVINLCDRYPKYADPNVNAKDKYGNTTLMYAVMNNNLEMVQYLIARHADVNVKNIFGDTPLMRTAIDGFTDIAQVLIRNGANVNEKNEETGETTAMYAAKHGSMEILRTLIEEKNVSVDEKNEKTGETLFMYAVTHHQTNTARYLVRLGANIDVDAVQNEKTGDTLLMYAAGYTDTAQFLIELGANVHARNNYGETVAMHAAQHGYTKILRTLIEEKNVSVNEQNEETGDTLIMYAAKSGYADTVQYLINQHANVNDCYIAAILAAKRGHTKTLQTLIDSGVDVNVKNEETGDTLLHTLLMCAVSEGKVDTARYLIEKKGADITGETEAMYAAMCGDTARLKTLIDNGVDVNARNRISGNTLLLYATMHEQTETMKYLIIRGAYLNAENNKGYTVDTYAAMTYNWEITEIIDETRKYPKAMWFGGHKLEFVGDGYNYDMAIRVGPAPEANHRAGGIKGLIGVHPEGHQGGENQRHDGNGLRVVGRNPMAQQATAVQGAGDQGNQRER